MIAQAAVVGNIGDAPVVIFDDDADENFVRLAAVLDHDADGGRT